MNSRFKFRVWDKYTHETPAEQMQFLCFDGCLVDSDGCHHSPDDYIVEQCTGLKDKNGKLIYEGDIVKDSLLGRTYTVNWDCDNVQFEATANVYDTEFSEIYGLYVDSAKELEIIGNVHEQAEQKEQDK